MATGTQPRIEILLEEVIKKKASDLHLQVGLPPMLRVDGSLTPVVGADILDEATIEVLIFSILDEDQKQILLKDKEFDFSFAFGDLGRFRVNAFHERGNLAAALRLIPKDILTIEQLGLPPLVSKFAEFPRGLVLITGPTGSGKSTTQAAIINQINMTRAAHIVTIEDPIEFTHKSQKSVIVQREVHYDTYSFSAALRSSLRQDPDVVLIGEMRDLETIAAAITIAETGHLVLATLHTNSASQSIDRMIDVFPPHQQPQIRSQLSNILMAICSQRLVPALGGGRISAVELLVATPAVRNIIREGKSHQLEAVIQTGAEFGMQSMDKTLVNLIHNGTISYDEARNYAVDLDELDRLMRS
jgi:twitching motility protein PilT